MFFQNKVGIPQGTKRKFSMMILLLMGSISAVFAQIEDDFSDGNFSQNPIWNGAGNDFIVNSDLELQLDAATAGSSILYTQGTIPDSVIWKMDIRMDFSPSNGNALKIYLLSDGTDFATSDAYFLKIGEDGGDDAIELYRQSGSAEVLLGRGTDGQFASNVDAKIEVKRSVQGDWTVSAGNQGQIPTPQIQVNDAPFFSGMNGFLGFECTYTASRADKFFFDNISVLPDLPDLQAPSLLSAEAINAQTISLQFDEALAASVVQNPSFFEVTPSLGNPTTIEQNAGNPALLRLTFTTVMESGTNYTLTAAGFEDVVGNVQNAQASFSFLYIEAEVPATFEILVNEFFPDPSPSIGLPEFEYIELHNPTNRYFDLGQVFLQDGSGSPLPLPNEILAPDSYIVLASDAAQGAFSSALPMLYWSDFPALNNSSDRIILSLLNGTLIDQVSYDLSWYVDTDKAAGGYALERINPITPCLGAKNWRASESNSGGTPGIRNSIFDDTADTEAPNLLSIFARSENELVLTFSEGLDASTQFQLASFEILPAVSIMELFFENNNQAELTVLLAENLELGQVYTLGSNGTVRDCAGNVWSANAVEFGLPEAAEQGDIVISELLWNPNSGGARFLELYNASDKIIELSNLTLTDIQASNPTEYSIDIPQVLLPKTYAVLTPNPSIIEARFAPAMPEWIYNQSLPSWPDAGGTALLYRIENGQRLILDSLAFDRDFHNALLTQSEKEGVSIERIDIEAPTQSVDNWTSAAGPFFGTPTGANTATVPTNIDSTEESIVSLPLARLSPDGDGFEDFLDIQYQLPSSGFAANVTIFNSNGLSVQRIERQQLIATAGTLRWDGDLADGSRARPGIYILYFEAFNPNGTVLREKIPFAVVFK